MYEAQMARTREKEREQLSLQGMLTVHSLANVQQNSDSKVTRMRRQKELDEYERELAFEEAMQQV